MKKIQFLFSVILLWLPFSVFAVTVSNLYQTEVPVMSQSDDDRSLAVREGLQRLLIRLTGDPKIDRIPCIKEAIARANYYVADIGYGMPTPQSATFSLKVRFEEAEVNRLLRKADITFWGDKRPLILVWLAVTDQKNITEVIGDESRGTVLNNLKRQGNKFGLPLIYPLMDMADMSVVSPADVTSMSLGSLQEAGKRYSPNGYLVGKISPLADGYDSEWELIVDKNHWKWTLANKTIDGVIADAMTETSQTLAKQFAIK